MKARKWVPMDGIGGLLAFISLCDNGEVIRLSLKDIESGRNFFVEFISALYYRNMDEGDMLKTFSDWDQGGWSLFTFSDSALIEYFIDEGFGVRNRDDVIHYAVYTENQCIDILSLDSPKVAWENDDV